METRKVVEDARALIAPLQSAVDNHNQGVCSKLLGDWDQETSTMALKQFEGGQEVRQSLCISDDQKETIRACHISCYREN